jgi:Arc/MetJ-type ribon-helix-helix transcriptional regulator
MSENDSQASAGRTQISVVMPDALIEAIEENDDCYMSTPELVRESIRWRLMIDDNETH